MCNIHVYSAYSSYICLNMLTGVVPGEEWPQHYITITNVLMLIHHTPCLKKSKTI